jgi:hypothetical protein
MPEILEIKSHGVMASRKAYTARVRYEYELPMSVYFEGPSSGGVADGAITLSVRGSGLHSRIDRPERFGEHFNRDWIVRFYGPRKDIEQ